MFNRERAVASFATTVCWRKVKDLYWPNTLHDKHVLTVHGISSKPVRTPDEALARTSEGPLWCEIKA